METINLTENEDVLTQDLDIAKVFNNFFSNAVQTLCNKVEKISIKSDTYFYFNIFFQNISAALENVLMHWTKINAVNIFRCTPRFHFRTSLI